MASKQIELPGKLAKLYTMLDFNSETTIDALYDVMFPDDDAEKERWQKQQYLGSFITRLNRRIVSSKERVVPGKTKGTYTLTRI